MRALTDGIFAIGIFTGVVFCLAFLAYFDKGPEEALGISFALVFGAMASGVFAALAGILLLYLTRLSARADALRATASVLLLHTSDSRARYATLRVHLERTYSDWTAGKREIHPLFMANRLALSTRVQEAPLQSITIIGAHDQALSRSLMKLRIQGGIINELLADTSQHREALLEKNFQGVMPAILNTLSINSAVLKRLNEGAENLDVQLKSVFDHLKAFEDFSFAVEAELRNIE